LKLVSTRVSGLNFPIFLEANKIIFLQQSAPFMLVDKSFQPDNNCWLHILIFECHLMPQEEAINQALTNSKGFIKFNLISDS
jgi:hypothetical protein